MTKRSFAVLEIPIRLTEREVERNLIILTERWRVFGELLQCRQPGIVSLERRQACEIEMNGGVLRLACDSGGETRISLPEMAQHKMRSGHVVVYHRLGRIDGQRLLVKCDGILVTIEREAGLAEIVIGVGINGVDGDRGLVVCDRFIMTSQHLQDVSQVVAGCRKAGPDFEGPRVVRNGLRTPAELSENIGEIIVRVGIFRLR
jgi:hypothetical protein